MGTRSYPQAKRLLITADSDGSNDAQVRLWKWELQRNWPTKSGWGFRSVTSRRLSSATGEHSIKKDRLHVAPLKNDRQWERPTSMGV
jgi:Rhodopirellula transposase DDE domain